MLGTITKPKINSISQKNIKKKSKSKKISERTKLKQKASSQKIPIKKKQELKKITFDLKKEENEIEQLTKKYEDLKNQTKIIMDSKNEKIYDKNPEIIFKLSDVNQTQKKQLRNIFAQKNVNLIFYLKSDYDRKKKIFEQIKNDLQTQMKEKNHNINVLQNDIDFLKTQLDIKMEEYQLKKEKKNNQEIEIQKSKLIF
jgi:hypothetical protein